MIRRTIKWTFGLLAVALLAVVVGIGFVVFVMGTEGGARMALSEIAARVPGELETGTFSGTLWEGLNFEALRYEDGVRRIEAEDLGVRVDWTALLAGTLSIRNASADVVRYTQLADEPPASGERDALPIKIRVRRGRVGQFYFDDETEEDRVPVLLEAISIVDLRTDGLSLQAAGAEATTIGLAISAAKLRLAFDDGLPISSDVSWRFEDWSGRGSIDGSLEALDVEQEVEGPYPFSAGGTVALLRSDGPRVEGGVTWRTWPIGDVRIDAGRAIVRGWIDDYELEVEAGVAIPGYERVPVSGTAGGSIEGIDTFTLTAESSMGSATLTGSAAWEPELEILAAFDAEGVAYDIALQADGEFSFASGELQCSDCRLRSGDNQLTVDGSIGDGGVDLDFAFAAPALEQLLPGPEIAATGAGRLAGPFDAMEGRLLAANVRIPGDLEWALQGGAEFRIQDGRVDIDAHRWTGSAGDIRIDELDIGDDTAVVARIRNIPLSLADAWLPQDRLRISGRASADVDVRKSDGAWSGTMDWRQSDTLVHVTDSTGKQVAVPVQTALLDVRLADGGLDMQAELAVEPNIEARLEATLSRLDTDADIDARLDFAGGSWGWVTAVFPEVDDVEGTVAAAFRATGPMLAPEIDGELRWTNGSFEVPELNIPVTDIEMVIRGGSEGTATITGSARAGDGSLTVNGQLYRLMERERYLELHIEGESANIINWPEYRAWASPDLNLTISADAATVSGTIVMPRADIEVRSLPESAVQVSPDVIVLGQVAPEETGMRFAGEVDLVLGDAVRIDAFGLEARLTGGLSLRLVPERPITARGQIVLRDGILGSFGRNLTLRDGELTFTGPLDDPLVDALAVREFDNRDEPVTVGLQLSGRATNLTTTLFSQPAMSDADILSYLIAGRPLEQSFALGTGAINDAATTFGVNPAGLLVGQVGRMVGLDELSVTTDADDATGLVAGTQINDRLYARYTYNTFSRLGVLLLRYRLSDQFTLEAGAGDDQSIDILYTIERE